MKKLIDSNLHTIPLKGELKRKPDGSKTLPVFEADWKAKYTNNRNTKVTPIGGVLTGSINNLIAIDCDCETSWTLFRSLDPDYSVCFESIGKGKTCGTILYSYDHDIDSFKIKDKIELDVLADGGMFYAPTEANETKETLESFEGVKAMPPQVKALLQTFQPNKLNPVRTLTVRRTNYNAPVLSEWMDSGRGVNSKCLKFLTPKSFREYKEYTDRGFVHPANVAKGAGSEYLSKVSAILGSDHSVSKELYTKVMQHINGLMKDPMEQDRFNSTVLDPMLEGRAKVNGEVLWAFDEDWNTECKVLGEKEGMELKVVYVPDTQQHLVICEEDQSVLAFKDERKVLSHLKSLGADITLGAIQKTARLVDKEMLFDQPWGLLPSDRPRGVFNTFKRSKYMEIIANRGNEEVVECPPTHRAVLERIKNPEEVDYLVRFMATKMYNFKYSPVSFVFFSSTNGTGKNIIIERIFGALLGEMYGDITISDLQDKYNSFMTRYLLASSDELGELGWKDAKKLYGNIKALTGKPSVSIRAMHSDPKPFKHSMTFTFTTNDRAFPFDETDRRFYVINMKEEQLDNADDPRIPAEGLYDKLDEEREDFARYLASVPLLEEAKYRKAPTTEGKAQKSHDFDSYEKTLVRSVLGTKEQFEDFLHAHELEHSDIAERIRLTPKITVKDIEELGQEFELGMDDVKIKKQAITRAMAELGVVKGGRTTVTTSYSNGRTEKVQSYPIKLNNDIVSFAS